MVRRYLGTVLGLLVFVSSGPPWTHATSPDVMDIPDGGEAVSGTVVPLDNLGVRILSHKAQWASFVSMGGAGEPMLLITGQLENLKDAPLSYVKLQYELLGEDGVVVSRDYGYNRRAEALRDEDYEAGTVSLADKGIERIQSGAQESFRFIFFKGDVPEFRSYRIRVVESK